MAVEQGARAFALRCVPLGDDHRVTGRFMRRDCKAQRFKLTMNVRGRLLHLTIIGRVGGDGGDAQKREQALQAGVKLRIGGR